MKCSKIILGAWLAAAMLSAGPTQALSQEPTARPAPERLEAPVLNEQVAARNLHRLATQDQEPDDRNIRDGRDYLRLEVEFVCEPVRLSIEHQHGRVALECAEDAFALGQTERTLYIRLNEAHYRGHYTDEVWADRGDRAYGDTRCVGSVAERDAAVCEAVRQSARIAFADHMVAAAERGDRVTLRGHIRSAGRAQGAVVEISTYQFDLRSDED